MAKSIHSSHSASSHRPMSVTLEGLAKLHPVSAALGIIHPMYDEKWCFTLAFEELNPITSQSCTCSADCGGIHLWSSIWEAEVEGLWVQSHPANIKSYLKIVRVRISAGLKRRWTHYLVSAWRQWVNNFFLKSFQVKLWSCIGFPVYDTFYDLPPRSGL